MTSKITRGDWHPFFDRNEQGGLIEAGVDADCGDGDHPNVCVTTPYMYDPEDDAERLQCEANVIADTHLLAAAKELLRGCQAALAYLADPPSVFPANRQEAVKIILAAVTKAKGK